VKLSFHVQYPDKAGWLCKALSKGEPGIIKQLFYGDDAANRWGDHAVVARLYREQHLEAHFVSQGRNGAEAYWRNIEKQVRGMDWVFAIEVLNEPAVSTSRARLDLAAFTPRIVQIIHEETGKPVVVGNYSNQNPDVTDAVALIQLQPAIEAGDLLGLHQYGRPSLQTDAEWASLRHRKLIDALRHKGIKVPPVLLTECGWDGTGSAYGQTGWKGLVRDFRKAVEELVWFNAELEKDQDVLAAFLFNTAGDAKWERYEFGKGEVNDILKALGGICPIPTIQEPPRSDVLPVLERVVQCGAELAAAYRAGDRARIRALRPVLTPLLDDLRPRLR